LSGISDRAVRREIEALRDEGVIIINHQDGKGYYISNDAEEMVQQYRQNRARAMAILRQQKHLRKKIKEAQNETLF
jgi:DNA-binding transcriptional regulator YhcF (GntR family)